MTRFDYFKSMDINDVTKYIVEIAPFPSCNMCSYRLLKPHICYKYDRDNGSLEIKTRPFVRTLCMEGVRNYLESEIYNDKQ